LCSGSRCLTGPATARRRRSTCSSRRRRACPGTATRQTRRRARRQVPDARQRSGPDVQRVGWVGVEGAARVGPLYDLGAGRRPLHIGSKRHRRFGRLRTLREVDDGGARGLVQHRGQRPRLRPQTQLDEWQVPSHHAGLGRAPPGDSWLMPARHPRASSGGSGGACAWQCVALI